MTAWDDEYSPPALRLLGSQIRDAFGLSADAIGMKGNTDHTYGYHRSRKWIYESGLGDDDYSVQSDLDRGGDENWICAIDITPGNVDLMIALSKRLEAALEADTLPDVREFYGNVDGDQWVDGWDDLYHEATTSDSSHLWHVHISFYRSRVGNSHDDVLRVLQGDVDMTPEEHQWLYDLIYNNRTKSNGVKLTFDDIQSRLGLLQAAAAADEIRDKTMLAAIQALTSGGTSVDTAAVINAITAAKTEAQQKFEVLFAENVELKNQVASLQTKLAAGAQAEANALKP